LSELRRQHWSVPEARAEPNFAAELKPEDTDGAGSFSAGEVRWHGARVGLRFEDNLLQGGAAVPGELGASIASSDGDIPTQGGAECRELGDCSLCMDGIHSENRGRDAAQSYPCCAQSVHAGCLRDLIDRGFRERPAGRAALMSRPQQFVALANVIPRNRPREIQDPRRDIGNGAPS
jgi:hypothetical protein